MSASDTDSDACSLFFLGGGDFWDRKWLSGSSEAGSERSFGDDSGDWCSVASEVPDEDDEENVGQLNAGDEFVAMLIEMYISSEITALNLCVLMFWASKGGIAGGGVAVRVSPR